MHPTSRAWNRAHDESDLSQIIETAYSSEADDATWLRKVAVAAKPVFDQGDGVLAAFVNAADRKLQDSVLLDCSEAHRRFAVKIGERLADHQVASVCRSNRTLTMARENAGLKPGEATPGRVRQLAEECGFVDATILFVADPAGFGFFLGAPLRRAWVPSRRERSRWSNIAAHLAAGYRLQRRTSTPFTKTSGAANEAMLKDDGKNQPAEGAARDRKSRDWLRHSAQSTDRAQATLRRENTAEVSAVWEVLVAGRWSIVDRFESNGRSYLIAKKNDPEVQRSLALSQRERQIVGYIALGHSNKFISYELGISESTVSECIKRARAKLGVRSNAELVQLLSSGSEIQSQSNK